MAANGSFFFLLTVVVGTDISDVGGIPLTVHVLTRVEDEESIGLFFFLAFLRSFGSGNLHSQPKVKQFVHGMWSVASQRTFLEWHTSHARDDLLLLNLTEYFLSVLGSSLTSIPYPVFSSVSIAPSIVKRLFVDLCRWGKSNRGFFATFFCS
jgi:hypothetical protein